MKTYIKQYDGSLKLKEVLDDDQPIPRGYFGKRPTFYTKKGKHKGAETEWLVQRWLEQRGNKVTNLNCGSYSYSRADLSGINKKGEVFLVEVKRRRQSKSKYPTTILEEDKFNYLIGHKNAFYCAVFDDGAYFINLHKTGIVVNRGQLWCDKTTDFADRNKVLKNVVFLDLSKAAEIDLNKPF